MRYPVPAFGRAGPLPVEEELVVELLVEFGVDVGVGVGVFVAPGIGVLVGPVVGVAVGAVVGVGVGVLVGVGVGVGVHVGTDMLSVSLVTVIPYARALPVHETTFPMVIAAVSITVPINVVFAARVVATGVQNTSQADAPPVKLTTEPAVVSSAPVDLNTKVPAPFRMIPPDPTD